MNCLLESLEERVVELGIEKLKKKVERLEHRRFFFFLRLRLLLNKIRYLKGE